MRLDTEHTHAHTRTHIAAGNKMQSNSWKSNDDEHCEIMHFTSVHTWSKIRVKVETWRYSFKSGAFKWENTKQSSNNKNSMAYIHSEKELNICCIQCLCYSAEPCCRVSVSTHRVHSFMMRCNDATVKQFFYAHLFGLYAPIYVMSFESEPYHHRSKYDQRKLLHA